MYIANEEKEREKEDPADVMSTSTRSSVDCPDLIEIDTSNDVSCLEITYKQNQLPYQLKQFKNVTVRYFYQNIGKLGK